MQFDALAVAAKEALWIALVNLLTEGRLRGVHVAQNLGGQRRRPHLFDEDIRRRQFDNGGLLDPFGHIFGGAVKNGVGFGFHHALLFPLPDSGIAPSEAIANCGAGGAQIAFKLVRLRQGG